MENIEVVLRIRPMMPAERESQDIEIWTIAQDNTVKICPQKYQDLVRMKRIVPAIKTEYTFSKYLFNRPLLFKSTKYI